MRIDTHVGVFADPATATDVAQAVAGLTAGGAFVILNDDRCAESYVQAAGTVTEDFLVEYRDGGAGDHFRGDRRVSAAELAELLVRYLQRTPAWAAIFTWHRVRVDFGAVTARA